MTNKLSVQEIASEKKGANACLALGAGVGILGATTAALTGAVCSLCVVVAPGLVGYGAYRKWKVAERQRKGETNEQH